MPIVNGTIYAEAQGLVGFDEINVLILGDMAGDLANFAMQVDTLHAYTQNTLNSQVRVKLHCTESVSDSIARTFSLVRHDLGELSDTNLHIIAKDLDIDVVLDQDNKFSKRYIEDKFYEFQIVKTLSELERSCEDFLMGNSIIWLFSNASWNMPLLMKYVGRPGLCRDYFLFMGECATTKGYSSEQQDRVRYIANRLVQVEYSKELIQYHLKRMRKAERNSLPEAGNLEINYHLGNYYFLIAGVMDSMARLINNIYHLGFTHPRNLGLEKEQFIEANRRKRTGFVRILTNKAFVGWLSFLKERRNFIAHDGDMRQSPLVEENDTLLTDEEVENLVNQELDWEYAATFLPQDAVQGWRNQTAQLIRIKHDYREVAKNIMIIPNLNQGEMKIYQPLKSIEYDYTELNKVMVRLLDKLKR